MKKLLLIVAILVAINPLYSALPKKNYVIEDHTGAWCGWCVRGIQVLEDLHANYGDRIIPLALHNGDTMATVLQKQIADTFGISGYPSGMVNRSAINVNGVNKLITDPDDWTPFIDANIQNATSIVDVKVDFSIDTEKKILTANVTAEFFADYSGNQLAFSLAIVEDSVTGTGNKWNQANYLSGASGYETNPFYYKTNPIKNFVFKDVVWDLVGGIKGVIGSLPAVIKNGEQFTHKFEVDLTKYPTIQNFANLWVAAMVKENNAKGIILNAGSKGKKPTPKGELYLSELSSNDLYIYGTANQISTQTITTSNKNSKDVKVIIKINKHESIIPQGWTYKLSDSILSIPAKSSKSFTLTTIPSDKPGCANYSISSIVQSTESIRGLEISAIAAVLSDKVTCGVIRFNDQSVSSLNYLRFSLEKIGYVKDSYAIIPYNKQSGLVFDFSKFDIILDCETYSTRNGTIFGGDNLSKNLNDYTLKGKPVLYTSCMNLWLIGDNYGNIIDPLIKQNFKDNLGITGVKNEWNPWWIWNGQTARADTINILGIKGNFTENKDFNINEYDPVNYIYDAWLDMINILDTNKAKPILLFNNSKIPTNGKIAAVKIERSNPNARAIYQGFSLNAIKNEVVRTTLLNNYIAWLLGFTSVDDLGNLNNADLKIYPNPCKDFVTLEFNLDVLTPVNFEIYSLSGELIQEYEQLNSSSQGQIKLDLSKLHVGDYFISITSGGLRSITKFSLMR